jgi:hypothetical protein
MADSTVTFVAKNGLMVDFTGSTERQLQPACVVEIARSWQEHQELYMWVQVGSRLGAAVDECIALRRNFQWHDGHRDARSHKFGPVAC